MDDRHGYYLEDITPGMSAVFGKTITEADLVMFAGVSGDTNPLHLDEGFARQTMAKGRIAHGMVTASLISTIVAPSCRDPARSGSARPSASSRRCGSATTSSRAAK